ncbi:MAG: hypothetical protein FWG11_02170 [Promicromonosporaceae bacterium]|nr:hypothetical protein [Promicromonosporaceae bacterium]
MARALSNGFVGRSVELAELDRLLAVIKQANRLDRGTALLLRGRRRVGKSRLVTEFIARSGVPSVYFQAARHTPPLEEFATLARGIAASDLPDASRALHVSPPSLTEALELLSDSLPADSPSIVVIDELPWLLEGIAGGTGQLQRVWDQRLSRKPVLLLLLGSDLGLMEAINRPDQPFYARASEMVLRELSPANVAAMTGLDGPCAFDSYLITGGLPQVAREWEASESPASFVARSFAQPTSALVISGQQVLADEFSDSRSARAVLRAIGGRGERSRVRIEQTAGLSGTALDATLEALNFKRVITADEPLSTRRAAKDRRWRVSDPALRFWLAMIAPVLGDIDRGRSDLAVKAFTASLPAWRGRAIEPVVREALERRLPNEQFSSTRRVGGWWPRSNTPEIDLVGADKFPATQITFTGTIKWRADAPLTAAEVANLRAQSSSVPGVGPATPVVAVCPSGVDSDVEIGAVWGADQLLEAWR